MLNAIIFASLLIGAIVSLVRAFWVVAKWKRGSAIIVGYKESLANEGGTMFHPVFNIDGSSKLITNTSRWGSWRKLWPKGTSVDVRIHPTDPDRVEIVCFANLFGISTTLFGLSAIAAIVLYYLA